MRHRGRVKERPPADAGPRRASATHSPGRNGPPCPDGHGPMLDWGHGVWCCMDEGHGGNGRRYKES